MLQTPPDMLQIPPDMHHIYYKYWHQCSKSIYIGISADVTDAGRTGRTTSEDRATQLLIWETLSLAISEDRATQPMEAGG